MTLNLPYGRLNTLLRLEKDGQPSYYKGPVIEVPTNADRLDLTLEAAAISNLEKIDEANFMQ